MSTPTTKIKAILFDLDGTLVDTAPKIREVVNTIRSQRGLEEVDIGLIRSTVGLGAERMIQICLGEALINVAADLRLFRTQLTVSTSAPGYIYPGVLRVLETLSPQVALGVVTNKPEQLARPLLEALGLARWFAVVVGGDTAAAPKPSAAPIAYALAAIRCEPGQALIIGDSDVDAGASTAAGCRFALFTGGYGPRECAAKIAEFEFASFGELVEPALRLALTGHTAAVGL